MFSHDVLSHNGDQCILPLISDGLSRDKCVFTSWMMISLLILRCTRCLCDDHTALIFIRNKLLITTNVNVYSS